MSVQEITRSKAKLTAFSEAVERDRRAFEMMAADKRLSFFDAMVRVMDMEVKR